MSFIRTNSGLSNIGIFLGVDIVVYTEGGISLSLEQVSSGEFNKKSPDIKFWRGVFNSHGFTRKVEFRALGSKTAARLICDKIASEEIDGVAVALDRDYDNFFRRLYSSPRIIYTKGYSWECDVFLEEQTKKQLEVYIMEDQLPEDVSRGVGEAYKSYLTVALRLIYLELYFRSRGARFVTDLGGQDLLCARGGVSINRSRLLESLRRARTKAASEVESEYVMPASGSLCPYRDGYGKLLQSISMLAISKYAKKHGHKAVPSLMTICSMIDGCIRRMEVVQDPHYASVLRGLEDSFGV